MASRYKMTLTIDYDENGTPPLELETQLYSILDYAANNGMMTGETSATVISYSIDIEKAND